MCVCVCVCACKRASNNNNKYVYALFDFCTGIINPLPNLLSLKFFYLFLFFKGYAL